MPRLITGPSRVEAAGTRPKLIDEYIGRVNSGTGAVSIAHMRSPGGWEEPGQTPEFDEYTVVLRGMLRVTTAAEALDVNAGQAVIVSAGERVEYFCQKQTLNFCDRGFSILVSHQDIV